MKIKEFFKKHLEGMLKLLIVIAVAWLVPNLFIYAFHLTYYVTILQVVAVFSAYLLLLAFYDAFIVGRKSFKTRDEEIQNQQNLIDTANNVIIALIAQNGNDGEAYIDIQSIRNMMREGVYLQNIPDDVKYPNKKGLILMKDGKRYLGGS